MTWQNVLKEMSLFTNEKPDERNSAYKSMTWVRIVVLEKILESFLDCEEIKSFNSKGNQPWIFTGRTDAEAETPILWPPDVKSWLIWEDPDAGNDRGQEEKRTTED